MVYILSTDVAATIPQNPDNSSFGQASCDFQSKIAQNRGNKRGCRCFTVAAWCKGVDRKVRGHQRDAEWEINSKLQETKKAQGEDKRDRKEETQRSLQHHAPQLGVLVNYSSPFDEIRLGSLQGSFDRLQVRVALFASHRARNKNRRSRMSMCATVHDFQIAMYIWCTDSKCGGWMEQK